MKKTIKNQKGFTLVELVLVITIIGIISVMALPAFIDITQDAHEAAIDGVLGAVKEGIQLKRVENILNGNDAYPSAADLESGAGTKVFEGVLSQGVDVAPGAGKPGWSNPGAGDYWYTFSNGTSWQFGYNAATGEIVRTL